jgi:hypothetical protein
MKNAILEKSPDNNKSIRTGKQKYYLLHFLLKVICHLSPVTDFLAKMQIRGDRW